ncbi:hypothetical protein [Hymenobacter cellulosivorans]|uniref:Uncharacterized protein n=1 Tax=Hymenobacter cellulosivorans TaxID=2932249 RepID=A0ABY4FEA1_9BACT|nr:hypothetical protein [Hymenobacter cellulosivorans]UOQ54342.1 hypothetical protein MUN80_06180 [Hymenobacter cellulosivorans]
MMQLPLIEVAISLALLYLFFSQVVLSGFELIASRINLRGRFLRHQLNKALNSGNDKNWAELVYRHPSVDMLAQTARRSPTYVPSSVFVKAIVDLVIDEARTHEFVPKEQPGPGGTAQPTGEYEYRVTDPVVTPDTALRKFEAGLANVSPGDFKFLLQSLLLNARGCTPVGSSGTDEQVFAEFLRGLAVWYDNYMERVTGWYKREIRPYLFLLGLVLAVTCNLDSIYVARYFWHHAEERRQVADYAAQVVAKGLKISADSAALAKTDPKARIGQQVQTFIHRADSLTLGLQARGYPIGWSIAARTDSTKLPDTFYDYHPTAYIPLGFWSWLGQELGLTDPPRTLHPSYWVKYQRQNQTVRPGGAVPTFRQVWQRDTLRQQPELVPGMVFRTTPPATTAPNLQQPAWLIGLGWLLTAAALSFGAPFWFELLNRLVNMRNQGLRPPTATPAAAKEST